MTKIPSGVELSKKINEAIRDGELSTAEYNEILAIVDADLHLDSMERQLLAQLQQLIENGTVKRIG
jgi:hypothetical protein